MRLLLIALCALFIVIPSQSYSLEAQIGCKKCREMSKPINDLAMMCTELLKGCADIPEEKRLTCEPGGIKDLGSRAVGCIKGVFRSAKELVGFLYQIAKFLMKTAVKAAWGGAKLAYNTVTDPIEMATKFKNKAVSMGQSTAMSMGNMAGYIAREFEVSRRKVGFFKAMPDMVERITGPIMDSAWYAISEFVGKQVDKYNCYNPKYRAEMVCKVMSDFIIPPAIIIGIIKGGGKNLFKNFPKLRDAIKGLRKEIGNDVDLLKIKPFDDAAKAKINKEYGSLIRQTKEDPAELARLIHVAESQGIPMAKIKSTIRNASKECRGPKQ